MDRTQMAPWKAEEKELSEKLHSKLQGLALLHPMNEELRKCLTSDMFLKPNHTAFFQVMHYLFRLLDPAEFKRRFFWPITDKKSEANFRSCTVDYLKHLNEKHQLQWANIKSYLVVMPGGMKFINFMLDFVGFVVQELIKQREKTICSDMDTQSLKNLSVTVMDKQNAFTKEYTSEYIEDLEKNTALLKEKTLQLRQIFAEISQATGVDENLLMDEKFLIDFEESNRKLLTEKITKPTADMAALEQPVQTLKHDIEKFLSRQAENKARKEDVDKSLLGIQKMFGTTVNLTEDAGSKFNLLLTAFNGISETIAEQLDAHNHYDESSDFVTRDLQELRKESAQIEASVTDVQRNLNARAKESATSINASSCTNSGGDARGGPQSTDQLQVPGTTMPGIGDPSKHPLMVKFVSTPPIKLERSTTSNTAHVRLPLQDDFNAKTYDPLSNSLLVPAAPRSARKMRAPNQTGDHDTTMNRSKIIDPLELLRTINKQTTKPKTRHQENNSLSSLGSKWKQLQASFGFDGAEAPAASISPKRNAPISWSPFTPLNSNEQTRIERLPQENSSHSASNASLLYAKKSSAVMKVLDVSLKIQNLSTSPSGRLDPLVPLPVEQIQTQQPPQRPMTPRVLLNDHTMNDPELKENNVNALNAAPQEFSIDLSCCEEDDILQNISDSVLTDIF